MKYYMKYAINAVLVMAMISAVQSQLTGGDKDVCGDMLPTDGMRKDPTKVYDWLQKDVGYQRVDKILQDHPFVRDIENGKMKKEDMVYFVVNQAYIMEDMIRMLGGALNVFGDMYPSDARDVFGMRLQGHRDALDAFSKLSSKFDIVDATDLLKHDPNPFAMMIPWAFSSSVQHARHPSVMMGSLETYSRTCNQIMQRIRDALKNRPEYKSWGLNADDLKFFDILMNMDQDDTMKQRLGAVMMQGLDQGITLCEIRRHMIFMYTAHLAFWDATGNMQPRNPIFQPNHSGEPHHGF